MGAYYVEWLEKQHDHLINEVRKKEKLIGEQIAELVNKTMKISDLEEQIIDQTTVMNSQSLDIENLRKEIYELENELDDDQHF